MSNLDFYSIVAVNINTFTLRLHSILRQDSLKFNFMNLPLSILYSFISLFVICVLVLVWMCHVYFSLFFLFSLHKLLDSLCFNIMMGNLFHCVFMYSLRLRFDYDVLGARRIQDRWNYPLLRQNKGVLLNTFEKHHGWKIQHFTSIREARRER